MNKLKSAGGYMGSINGSNQKGNQQYNYIL